LPVLALVPGDRRADPDRIAAVASARYARVAKLDEVTAATGFEAGGVAPFPVPGITRVLLERALLRQSVVWAGAGSAKHMVALSPTDLARVTQAQIADICEA
jgi:prolyl-tRNA editing enzyme YbaK/EbsC (Cys-tRNA(Pro) deacylase)